MAISKKRRINFCRGASIVEVLVAVAMFSLVAGAATGLFISALKVQRNSLASQETLDQVSFAFEYMSRAMRMARKEISAPACLSENGLSYELTRAGAGIKFINYQGLCDEFFLEDNILKEKRADYLSALPITSARLSVAAFNVFVSGESENDDIQPLVVFLLKAGELNIQTSVSQRNLDM